MLNIFHQRRNFPGGIGGAARQGAYFIGHYRKTTTVITGPCRFNRRVQRQQVGLFGNAADHIQHGADIAGMFQQATGETCRLRSAGAGIGNGLNHRLHGLVAVADQLRHILGGAGSLIGNPVHLLRGGVYLFHLLTGFVHAAQLFARQIAGVAGQLTQFYRRLTELAAILMQGLKGAADAVHHLIKRPCQLTQLILILQLNAQAKIMGCLHFNHPVTDIPQRVQNAPVAQPAQRRHGQNQNRGQRGDGADGLPGLRFGLGGAGRCQFRL